MTKDISRFRAWLAGMPPAGPTAAQWIEIMRWSGVLARDLGAFLDVAHGPGGFVVRVARHRWP